MKDKEIIDFVINDHVIDWIKGAKKFKEKLHAELKKRGIKPNANSDNVCLGIYIGIKKAESEQTKLERNVHKRLDTKVD